MHSEYTGVEEREHATDTTRKLEHRLDKRHRPHGGHRGGGTGEATGGPQVWNRGVVVVDMIGENYNDCSGLNIGELDKEVEGFWRIFLTSRNRRNFHHQSEDKNIRKTFIRKVWGV